MNEDQNNDPRVIVIPFEQRCKTVSSAPTREELASMIKKVLSPSELFKMNTTKKHKSKAKCKTDVIKFDFEEISKVKKDSY